MPGSRSSGVTAPEEKPDRSAVAEKRQLPAVTPTSAVSFWALGAPRGLVIAVAVRVGAAVRYKQAFPLHLGYRDPAFLSTIPGLALVV